MGIVIWENVRLKYLIRDQQNQGIQCTTKMLPLLPLFLPLAFSSASPLSLSEPLREAFTKGVCGDFLEGACDLSENNILDHNRFTDTPAGCQDLCKQNSQCH